MDVYFTIIVAVFSILVSALITWQIYSYLVIEKKIKSTINEEITKSLTYVRKVIECDSKLAEANTRISSLSLHNVITDSALRNNDFITVLKVYTLTLTDLNGHYKESLANDFLPTLNSFINLCVNLDLNLDVVDLNKLHQGLRELASNDHRAFDILINLDRLHRYVHQPEPRQ